MSAFLTLPQYDNVNQLNPQRELTPVCNLLSLKPPSFGGKGDIENDETWGERDMKKSWMVHLLGAMLCIPVVAQAGPTLHITSPVDQEFVEGVDFVAESNGFGTGTASGLLQRVDLVLPPGPVPSTSTSGCETSDFLGFGLGNIALMQRGTCPFELKVHNAFLAGAIGALIFNEGQAGRTEPLPWTCDDPATSLDTRCEIPSLFTSFAVGNYLATLLERGPVEVSISVPEPGSLALLGLGLAGLAAARRRTLN